MERNWEKELQVAAKRVDEAHTKRDEVILKASKAGMTRRAVAKAVGLTGGRIQQIVRPTLVALILLFGAESAQATQVVEAPCPNPPEHVEELGCADYATDTIYINPGLGRHVRRAVLRHERGHFFDHFSLEDAERARISKMLGWTTWRDEAFADRYAACHLSDQARHHAFPFATWGRDDRLCRLLPRFR